MSDPIVSALGDVLTRLEQRVAETRWPAPEAAFVAHVAATAPARTSEALVKVAKQLRIDAAREPDGARWSEAPVLAAAGYVIGDGAAPNRLVDHWRTGVARLADREPFPSDRASFFYRPVELYGLARGACVVGGEFADWLGQVVADGERRVPDDVWHRTLGAAAAAALERPWSLTLSANEVDTAGVDELALVTWLAATGSDTVTRLLGARADRAVLERELLERAVLGTAAADDAARAAVIAVTLRGAVEAVLESAHASRWQLTRDERDAGELVIHLCRRFPRFVRQLASRHQGRTALSIDDEYDVQDSVQALLKLHFDDVRPEEWAPSYAGSRTRMDFLLKAEQTVVETKMTRERLDQRRVVDELVIDKAHYRWHPACKTLICFVYDPEHRLDNPDALENDVSGDEDGLATRVVVAPRPS